MYRIRTVIRDCVRQGLTRNNPFDRYAISQPIYGDPFYLTIEERDKVHALDLSGYHPSLAVYRDLFVLQCMIGCRAADLNRLTKGNVVNGAVTSERLRSYCRKFEFKPKSYNINGLQIADLIAYPIARHILDPQKNNLAYAVIEDNIYREGNKVKGLKILP